MSRDLVARNYIMKLIGLVNEASALDGVMLVDEEDQGASFEKESMSYIKDVNALSKIHNTVRPKSMLWSSNTSANIQAQMDGNDIIQRGTYDQATLKRLTDSNIAQSTNVAYPNFVPPQPQPESEPNLVQSCPNCGFRVN